MRSRCAAGIFHRSAVFSCRICFLVHLTIRPPESDRQSESYRAIKGEPQKDPKPLDSISYGSGMIRLGRIIYQASEAIGTAPQDAVEIDGFKIGLRRTGHQSAVVHIQMENLRFQINA